MRPRIRIRGIYATALTKLLADEGFWMVDPSEEIARRFGLSQGTDSEEAEINDKEDKQGVVISGDNENVNSVIQIMRKHLPDLIVRDRSLIVGRSALGQRSIISATPDSFEVEVEFTLESKRSLDNIRNEKLPTLPYHHWFRIIASSELDRTEEELARHPEKREQIAGELRRSVLLDSYVTGKELMIEHVRPGGRVFWLSEGKILEFNTEEMRLVLKRARFKGRGVYDGLGVPKAEGDYAITTAREGSWTLRHSYHSSDNSLKGEYYNVNTPIEFYPDKIRYIDLEVDVVKWPDGRTKIIDREELEEDVERGFVSPELAAKALRIAEELQNSI